MRTIKRVIIFLLVLAMQVTAFPAVTVAAENESLRVLSKQTVKTSGRNGSHNIVILYTYDDEGYLVKRTHTRDGDL